MSEWWTYRPSDFLMFAPRTYWRLFEMHNEAWWPAQPALVLAGLAWLAWALRGGAAACRVGAASLAAAWGFVALAFLLRRYAPINWAATGFAGAFLAQALGLALLATRADLRAHAAAPRRRIGAILFGGSMLAWPLLAPASGRAWSQAEFFGLAPDPTAIATLGVLLFVAADRRRTQWLLRLLWTLAIAWCAVSTATLWTMGSAQVWAVLAAALVATLAVASARGGRLQRA